MRLAIALVLSGLFLMSCNREDATTPLPGEDATRPLPGHVWVATEPIQCLGNPWERDWLESHGGDYSLYPKDPATPGLEPEEFEIIQDYYAGQGVEVIEAQTASKYPAVCAGCACPEGYTLYLLVRAEDLQQMIDFGYRAESPK